MKSIVNIMELNQSLGNADLIIVDCRFDLANTDYGLNAWKQGHIPDAIYANLDHDLSGPVTTNTGRHPLPDADAFRRLLANWGLNKHSHVVAYDDGAAMFASRLWWLLRWYGHQQVSVLDGGWNAWQAAGLAQQADALKAPQVTDYPENLQPDLAWLVDADSLSQQLQQGVSLWDARDPRRFSGEIEPIDIKAGHIPGAVNVPFMDNLQQGGFLSTEALRARFDALLGDTRAEEVIHMCGSGVTACQNLLAMEIAGYKPGRLYAGSWSEWITDDSRPVETGC